MSTDVSNINFSGARIVRVTEDVDPHRVTFEVSDPMPNGGSDFPRRKLIFGLCKRYLVDERDMPGEPVILRVEIIERESHRVKIRMHTDHGVRELTCWAGVHEESL